MPEVPDGQAPFFAVTGARRIVRNPGAPLERYTRVAWQELYGTLSAALEQGESGEAKVDFTDR